MISHYQHDALTLAVNSLLFYKLMAINGSIGGY